MNRIRLSSLEESGLKCRDIVKHTGSDQSLLTWGEWIEIWKVYHTSFPQKSLLTWGEWIEIGTSVLYIHRTLVSPHLRRVDWNHKFISGENYQDVSPHLRRVDWNLPLPANTPMIAVSPHLRRVDWNHKLWTLFTNPGQVSPHLRRVDWNTKTAGDGTDTLTSLLTWGEWIEIGDCKYCGKSTRSLSSLEESGLKYCLRSGSRLPRTSLLTWGEWIEIPCCLKKNGTPASLLTWGEWIEITSRASSQLQAMSLSSLEESGLK